MGQLLNVFIWVSTTATILLVPGISLSVSGASRIVEICEKPAVEGNRFCFSEKTRWTYKSEDEECVKAGHYSGCGQTENNFESKEACERICGSYKDEPTKRKKTYPDACSLPGGKTGDRSKPRRSCFGRFRRFYFDQKTRTCIKFNYGGCGGNANMFNSAEQCEHYCIRNSDN